MKKKIGLILLSMIMAAMPLTAATIKIDGAIQRLESGESIIDKMDASYLKVSLPDAYKMAGKTEKVKVTLQNAIWETNDLTLEDVEGVEETDIALAINKETEVEFYVKIPSGLTKGTEVSFSLPILMMMNGNDDIAYVTVSDGDVLFEAQRFAVAANTDKLLILSVGEVEEFTKQGVVAPITLEEVVPSAIGTGEVSFLMTLEDSEVEFGTLNYTDKREMSNGTVYTLDSKAHIELGGGFDAIQEDMEVLVRQYTGNKRLYVTVKANLSSEEGRITLKNIPLIYTGEAPKNRAIKATIEENHIIGTGKNIIVAQQVMTTTKEQESEKQAEEDAKQGETQAKEEAKEESRKIRFTVGSNTYSAYGKTYEMDGKVFLESPGYVMVPIRYVAEALGVNTKDIIYGGGDLSFNYGGRDVLLSVGSHQAWVNRTPITMGTQIKIIEGRSYAPLGEVARILGVQKEWDTETKTAIFTK